MLSKLADKLIERGMRTPYYHLYHLDGSPYMLRYWLVPKLMLAPGGEPQVDAGLSLDPQAGWFQLRDDVRHLPAARLHNIITPDLDREMHNHPWSFISIVLRGGYIERRPLYPVPQFYRPLRVVTGEMTHEMAMRAANPPMVSLAQEEGYTVKRGVGSIAFRSYNDRHRIVHVEPDTWTLVLMGPKRQTWGFFTREGFVNWREFSSAHNTEPL